MALLGKAREKGKAVHVFLTLSCTSRQMDFLPYTHLSLCFLFFLSYAQKTAYKWHARLQSQTDFTFAFLENVGVGIMTAFWTDGTCERRRVTDTHTSWLVRCRILVALPVYMFTFHFILTCKSKNDQTDECFCRFYRFTVLFYGCQVLTHVGCCWG